MSPAPSIRITTLCVGRVCVEYHAPTNTSLMSQYAAVATVFSVTFISVWVLVTLLLVLCEAADSISRLGHLPDRAFASREQRLMLCRELVRFHSALDEECPLRVVEGSGSGCECAVCLEEIGAGDVGRRLACGHLFHASCIDRWVLQTVGMAGGGGGPVCPLCKCTVLGGTAGKAAGREHVTVARMDVVVSGHEGYDVVYNDAVAQTG